MQKKTVRVSASTQLQRSKISKSKLSRELPVCSKLRIHDEEQCKPKNISKQGLVIPCIWFSIRLKLETF